MMTNALPAIAEKGVIPAEAVILISIGVALLVVFISIIVSYLFRLMIQYFRKEKRKHIWFMVITTITLPGIYLLAEDRYSLLYYSNIELNYGYEVKAFVGMAIIILFILCGFLIGYFITPKVDSDG